jgi:hypothetical protein
MPGLRYAPQTGLDEEGKVKDLSTIVPTVTPCTPRAELDLDSLRDVCYDAAATT